VNIAVASTRSIRGVPRPGQELLDLVEDLCEDR
jgi:hypothetical protein